MEGILETIDELLTALAMELTFWCGVAWLGLCIAEQERARIAQEELLRIEREREERYRRV